jgi:hypothetical protein
MWLIENPEFQEKLFSQRKGEEKIDIFNESFFEAQSGGLPKGIQIEKGGLFFWVAMGFYTEEDNFHCQKKENIVILNKYLIKL